jgi:hypothetical protein
MAKTAKKFWNQEEERVVKKSNVTYVCTLCERVKSYSLTRALFGHWHDDPDTGQKIVVCHHCQEDDG